MDLASGDLEADAVDDLFILDGDREISDGEQIGNRCMADTSG